MIFEDKFFNTTVFSSVIRQKDESQKGCFKKTRHGKFSEKHISYLLICARIRGYNYASSPISKTNESLEATATVVATKLSSRTADKDHLKLLDMRPFSKLC